MTNANDPINTFTYQGRDGFGDPCERVESGLTKREYFAAMALQGLLATGMRADVVKDAVVAADVLIEELNATK